MVNVSQVTWQAECQVNTPGASGKMKDAPVNNTNSYTVVAEG